MLFDSVAPEVKKISFGWTLKKRAIVMRASSTAFAARRPCSCPQAIHQSSKASC